MYRYSRSSDLWSIIAQVLIAELFIRDQSAISIDFQVLCTQRGDKSLVVGGVGGGTYCYRSHPTFGRAKLWKCLQTTDAHPAARQTRTWQLSSTDFFVFFFGIVYFLFCSSAFSFILVIRAVDIHMLASTEQTLVTFGTTNLAGNEPGWFILTYLSSNKSDLLESFKPIYVYWFVSQYSTDISLTRHKDIWDPV